MKINYSLQDITLQDNTDLELLKHIASKNMYLDEVVINLHIKNDSLLQESISVIKESRFGTLRRLPLVNIYFDANQADMLSSLSNEIKNFITPIIKLNSSENCITDTIKKILSLLKQKGWKLQILLDVKNIEEFERNINFYNFIKCEFFEEDICILFKFKDDLDLLRSAYLNMNYVMDTIKFLGMRNNVIVDCLLKAIREKETGISQDFDSAHYSVMKKLMQFKIERYYEKKTLIRATMDDFAMV